MGYLTDINGDGLTDVLCARNREAKNGYDYFWNQLLWFETPAENAKAGYWKPHILYGEEYNEDTLNQGPALNFDVADIDGDGNVEIVYTEFWGKTLAMFHTTDFTDPEKLTRVVVSDDHGSPYGCNFVDVNNDGRLDILYTNHEIRFSRTKPMFGFFEIPADFKSGSASFKWNLIDGDLNERTSLIALAPGFFTTIDTPGLKPQLSLATDGGGKWFMYTPENQDANSTAYVKQELAGNKCDFMQPEIYYDDETDGRYLLCGC